VVKKKKQIVIFLEIFQYFQDLIFADFCTEFLDTFEFFDFRNFPELRSRCQISTNLKKSKAKAMVVSL